MTKPPKIVVELPQGEHTNGLGNMLAQYLDQNFADFPNKTRQAADLSGSLSLEADKGVAITMTFSDGRVAIINGVDEKADAHIRSDFVALSKIATGHSHPLSEMTSRKLSFVGIPRRPIFCWRVLKLLRVPPSDTETIRSIRKRRIAMAGAAGLIAGIAAAVLWLATH